MSSAQHIDATLQERIERLEKHNRRLTRGMVASVCCLVALGLMGAKAATQDGHFRHLTADDIAIVDAAGQRRILLGAGDEGVGMSIVSKAGQKVVRLGIAAKEHGSGIVVADNEGRPRIGLGLEGDLPSVAMVNEKGKKIMAMGGAESSYGFVIMDDNEVERAGLGFDKGNVGVMIYDDSGQYVRGMIRQKDGVHYSSYLNEKGKEVIER